MGEVIQFIPKAELDAEQNLAEFVRECKSQLTAFGADLPFDEDVWDISSSIQRKGRTSSVRIFFSSQLAAREGKSSPSLSPGFLEFAKAYLRYMHGMRPTTAFAQRLTALRLVDLALSEAGRAGRVTAINHDILNRACSLAVEHYSAGVAPKVAGQLELLADFLVSSRLVDMKTKWLKSIRKPVELNLRVGKDADAARQKRMPSAAAIEAMAHVFVNAELPAEKYVGATLALLHCAPQRINETVRLKVGCEEHLKDKTGAVQYGLRWPGSKRYEAGIKWMLPTMAEVAQRAVAMLLEASAPARAIAAWYEECPRQIYLNPSAEHLRSVSALTATEVSLILFGVDDARAAVEWCQREKIARTDSTYPFDDVQSQVLKKLPKRFPYAQPGVRYSESLFAMRLFELDATLRTYHCLVAYLSSDQIASRIGRSGSVVGTIFDRFNLSEDDGSPLELASHQVRHYLNTLAQANGATQLDIAMWSGRADVGQNKAYDHVTPERLLTNVRALVTSTGSQLFGGDLNVPKTRVLARREGAGHLITGSSHISDFGMCTHDYVASPCQINMDCLNCNELVCVKGDMVKTNNLRRLKDSTEEMLRQAEIAEHTETYGASRWVEHHRRMLEHCTQLLALIDNPAVEEGAVIRLVGLEPASRLEQARAERNGAQTVALPVRKNKLLERVKRG